MSSILKWQCVEAWRRIAIDVVIIIVVAIVLILDERRRRGSLRTRESRGENGETKLTKSKRKAH